MSATSRSFARSLALVVALTGATAACASLPGIAPLPSAVATLLPQAQPRGGGELSWYGLPIYRGSLWSSDESFSLDKPFVLDLVYRRAFSGAKIAQRSVEEMAQLGATPVDLARWGEAMARIFPDVRAGDRISGVHLPGRGARFFHNGQPVGEIAEANFARAFFGIWLDPRTSQPELRRQLLGQK
ncbi:MAG: chalcone isomerase family protein [Betaproteobacteria bacterium]|jgi:hypothetical protein|nr:chalcone isomerase family protein [Betaproteobacteria bacterium]MDH5287555.1 chalcone isomerase family protein [Betaproteobacteria bacterium]